MQLRLINNKFESYGIFGDLCDAFNTQIAVTLQHAYPEYGGFYPKIPEGTFTCVRGMHRLDHMVTGFETFEVLVKGHMGLLFHVGNTNKDSDGCILLGENILGQSITNSRQTFQEFLDLLDGVDSFTLEVVNLTPLPTPA